MGAEQAVHVLILLGSDAVGSCFKRTTDTTDAPRVARVKAWAALLAAYNNHVNSLNVETESMLMLVYSTAEGDGGKQDDFGYVHVQ